MRMVHYTYKTFKNNLQTAVLACVLLFLAYNPVAAQCDMVCNNLVQVSLDSDCEATIDPDVILEGLDAEIENMLCDFYIEIYDADGEVVGATQYVGDPNAGVVVVHPTVSGDYIGQTLDVGVWSDDVVDDFVDTDTANNCWSMIKVEDKLASQIVCLEPFSIPCTENLTASQLQNSSTNQTYQSGALGTSVAAPALGGVATESVVVDITSNASAQFEVILELTYCLDITPAQVGTNVDIAITSADGTMTTPFSDSTVDGTDHCVTTQLFDYTQTTDAFMEGMWTIDLQYTGTDAITINSASINVQSVSALNSQAIVENCGAPTTEIISDITVPLDCRDDNVGSTSERVITYVATDGSGQEQECTVSIFLDQITLDDVTYPDNVLVFCSEDSDNQGDFDDIFTLYDDNNDGELTPDETGVPTLNGVSLYPMPTDNPCKLNVSFSDHRIDICPGTFKIHRTFTVFDWCNAELEEHTQFIEQVDDIAPTVSTILGEVVATTEAEPYSCSSTFTLDFFGGAFEYNDDNYIGLEAFVYDCSGFMVIGAGYKEANPDGSVPGSDVEFIYDDGRVVDLGDGVYRFLDMEGPRVWVQFLVEDKCGNAFYYPTNVPGGEPAAITVEVDIVDTTPPIAVCDEFTTVTLSAENGWGRVYAESLDDGSYDFCGDVSLRVRRTENAPCVDQSLAETGHNDLLFNDFIQVCCDDLGTDVMVELEVTDEQGLTSFCMVVVRPQDKSEPTVVSCPTPTQFTYACNTTLYVADDPSAEGPVLQDNCTTNDVFPLDSGSLSDCGAGSLTRRWYYNDADGNQIYIPGCDQSLTFTLETISESDIRYPSDLVGPSSLQGCMEDVADPANSGVPTYRNTGTPIDQAPGCGMIAYTHEDQVFTDVSDACIKILRTWTVIDWCIYDPTDSNSPGYYQGHQTIMISDDELPQFETCGPEDSAFNLPKGQCSMNVSASASAFDVCTDATITEVTKYSWELTQFGVGLLDSGIGNSYSGSFEEGRYTLTWTVTGNCGATNSCSSVFTVSDVTPPTPYCNGGITTVILAGNQSVEVWASDLDLGSGDDCSEDVTFTFANGSGFMTFDCDQLGVNTVEVYVTDSSGNSDFCTTTVTVQANDGACSGISRVSISGRIMTDESEGINNVTLQLEHMYDNTMDVETTIDQGFYSFDDVAAHGDYHLKAIKDDDPRNGISTLDIILIQRHILGLDQLDNVYKVIAADADNNERITAGDIVDIRRLILEHYDKYPDNSSWRFIKSDAEYVDFLDPWPLDEDITFQNIYNNEVDVNWTGVKVGDVNGSVLLQGLTDSDAEVRSGNIMNLDIMEVTPGVYEVVSRTEATLAGFQMKLDATGIKSINANTVALLDKNVVYTDNGAAISYDDINTFEVNEGDVLFTINASPNTEFTLSDAISAEGYDSDLQIVDINLNGSIENTVTPAASFVMHQNIPNPFAQATNVQFELPAEGEVMLEILDVTGRVLFQSTKQYAAGVNSIQISDDQIGGQQGVIYYRMSYEGQVQTKKMILLD